MFSFTFTNHTLKIFISLFMVFLVTVNVSSQKTEEKDFGKYFSAHNINGCFLLFDPESNLYIEYNHEFLDMILILFNKKVISTITNDFFIQIYTLDFLRYFISGYFSFNHGS